MNKTISKKILVSINPKHVVNILNETKKYEYRKNVAKQNISSIIIYETTPTKKIVAEVEIIDILTLSPKEMWKKTKEWSGISKKFFDVYFHNRKIAYAYKLGKIKIYNKPKTLNEYGIKNAPQSFIYI